MCLTFSWTLQTEDVESDKPVDVSTVKSLLKKNQPDKTVHISRKDTGKDKIIQANGSENEDYDSNESDILHSEHYELKTKSDLVSLKENSSVVMYNSVKFQNKEIVEYSRTNFSLAKNVVDNITLDKLIKSPLIRKHDIINDTVDVWAEKSICSYDDVNIVSKQNVSYKPLIFGGTYPIDEPTGVQIRRSAVQPQIKSKTFNIDRPISLDK